jgi:hypothetical protein
MLCAMAEVSRSGRSAEARVERDAAGGAGGLASGRRGGQPARPPDRLPADYFRWLLTSFVISNIETWSLPPKTFFRFASALIIRFCFGS